MPRFHASQRNTYAGMKSVMVRQFSGTFGVIVVRTPSGEISSDFALGLTLSN